MARSCIPATQPISMGTKARDILKVYTSTTIVHFHNFFSSCFSQLVMTLLGFVANLATFIVLKKHSSIFSQVIRILLMNQSLIDSIACLFAAIIILQVESRQKCLSRGHLTGEWFQLLHYFCLSRLCWSEVRILQTFCHLDLILPRRGLFVRFTTPTGEARSTIPTGEAIS